MNDKPQRCDVCNKPMVEGQAFYAGLRHWGCQYPEGYKSTEELFAEMRAASDRMESALNNLVRKLK